MAVAPYKEPRTRKHPAQRPEALRRAERDYRRRYRKAHVVFSITLAPNERERLRRLERRHGLGPTDLFRLMLSTLERQRASEAHDKVRVVVPDAVARVDQMAAGVLGEALMALAGRMSKTQDGRARADALRGAAGIFMDAEAWNDDIVSQYDRLQEQPEHPRPPGSPPDPATIWRTRDRTTLVPPIDEDT